MDELIDLLNKLCSTEKEVQDRFVPESDLVCEIENRASDVLINQGRPNLKGIYTLKENGFIVVAGEKDMFGWVTGVIKTPVGKIAFG